MAKKRRKKAKKRTRSHAKGHVPLKILEKRYGKLGRIIKARGGKT